MKTRIPPSTLVLGVCLIWSAIAAAQDSDARRMMDAVAELPGCATSCVVSAIQDSPCSMTNATCICQDSGFETATEACSKNIFETTCDRPVRDRAPEYATLTWTLIGLTTFIVAARLIHNYFSPTPLGLDDLFSLLAFLAVIPSFVINLVGLIPAGLGKDIWTLAPHQIDAFGFWFYILEPMYFVQMGLVKMAILSFCIRVFDRTNLARLLWATAAFNAANTVAFVFAAVFQCSPISYYWKRWDGDHEGSCNDINALAWANAGVSIALDLWILTIPLFKIRTLKLHWWKKMAAGLMFGVGTFVTVISILRLRSLVLFAKTENPTWDQFELAFWTTLEVPVGIICACLPAVRQILIKALPSWFGRLTNKYYGADRYASATSGPDGRNSRPNMASRGPGAEYPAAKLGVVGSRRGTMSFGARDSVSETADTSNLYSMRDLGGVEDDKVTLRRETSMPATPSSSIAGRDR